MTIMLNQFPIAPTPPALTDTAIGIGGGITNYQYTFTQIAATIGAANPVVLRNYLGGLQLSNDGTSPNTVVDVSAGECADSTNAVMIVNTSSFTKSISSSWVAGTGNGGLGNGLSLTASTTYHVFAIINSGTADVYFDTSASAGNAPVGTTAFRRIGSVLVNSSSHITTFLQQGSWFFINEVISLNTNMTNGANNTFACNVPTGISVIPLLTWQAAITATAGGSASTNVTLTNSASTLSMGSIILLVCQASQNSDQGTGAVMGPATDTSGNIRYQITSGGAGAFAASSLIAETVGWMDTRGQ